MKRYILDTNIASLLGSQKDGSKKILEKFYELDDNRIMVSIVTLYEAQYGLENSEDKEGIFPNSLKVVYTLK